MFQYGSENLGEPKIVVLLLKSDDCQQVKSFALYSCQATPNGLVKVTTHSINGGLFGKVGEILFFGKRGNIFTTLVVNHSSSFS